MKIIQYVIATLTYQDTISTKEFKLLAISNKINTVPGLKMLLRGKIVAGVRYSNKLLRVLEKHTAIYPLLHI